ncbi:hypothetical protein DENSPDRAFT_232444 [Dentipellis sp. KUC8613]|nr:hypothetical protein DENSPDRAFT_232444 [Dentipellis sp. KUC8613]
MTWINDFEKNFQAHAVNNRHKCLSCGTCFADAAGLKDHLAQATHFRCNVCSRGFGSSRALCQHLFDSPKHRLLAFKPSPTKRPQGTRERRGKKRSAESGAC